MTHNKIYAEGPLSDETLEALEKLGAILMRWLLKIRAEGYDLRKDGTIIRIETGEEISKEEWREMREKKYKAEMLSKINKRKEKQ